MFECGMLGINGLTLVLLNPAFANSVDPDQLASELFPLSMWIYINYLDQVIWLAEN